MNAVVTNVTDPQNKLRIRFLCPLVLGLLESEWAAPATPGALPAVGDAILASFTDGDLNRPVWFGSSMRGTDRITVVGGVVDINPTYVLPISQGGTGGTTPFSARTSLNAVGKAFVPSFTASAGVTYNIPHNYNTAYPVVQVWDTTTNEKYYGATEKYVDVNTVSIKCDVTMNIKVVVLG
jgi:hypothetical protein